MVKTLNIHKLSEKMFWKSYYFEKACFSNMLNLWRKSLKMNISFFIDIFFSNRFLVAIFEQLQGVGFHRVYTYYFKIKWFLLRVFDMSHLCFIFKQDICSTECKKYTVNPVNTPWVYTGIKDKFDGSIFGGGLIYGGA